MKKNLLLLSMFLLGTFVSFAQPTAGPGAAASHASIISLVENGVQPIITNINPGWGQVGSVNAAYAVTDGVVLQYLNLTYQGANITPTDVTGMTHLHMDVYPTTTPDVKFFIYKTGDTETSYTLTGLTLNAWNSIDIPLATLAIVTPSAISEMKWETVGQDNTLAGIVSTIYVDNLMFYTDVVDFTSLNNAIAASTANSTSVTVSVDGADVLTSAEWVLQADLDTFLAAIADAQLVADNTGATQIEVNAAVTALAAAATAFEAAKAPGTMASGVFDVEKSALNIYPNPSNGIFTVNTTNEYTVDVVSASGKIVKTQVINASSNSIDLTGNEAGVYILNFKNDKQSFPSSIILK